MTIIIILNPAIFSLTLEWYYLPTPPLGQKRSLTGFNSEFSFS